MRARAPASCAMSSPGATDGQHPRPPQVDTSYAAAPPFWPQSCYSAPVCCMSTLIVGGHASLSQIKSAEVGEPIGRMKEGYDEFNDCFGCDTPLSALCPANYAVVELEEGHALAAYGAIVQKKVRSGGTSTTSATVFKKPSRLDVLVSDPRAFVELVKGVEAVPSVPVAMSRA